MTDAVIAISTYGGQRVTHPGTQQTVSAHKIGYSSAAAEVLLALYGKRAQNVSPRQASYIYLQIDGEVVVRHGYILLKVSADEVQRAEMVTRRFQRAACFLWREDRWWELPTSRTADYTAVVGRSGPDFNPSGFRVVSAATGEKESVAEGIRAERSQRNPNETPWWWLFGETYPHRDLLKRHGARFSGKRKAWYLIAWELPDAIRALVNSTETEAKPPLTSVNEPDQVGRPDPLAAAILPDDDPCTLEEAAAILGMPATVQGSVSIPTAEPPRLFPLGAPVYARHDLTTPEGKLIPTGSAGKITRWYNRNRTYGYSYDVDFEGIGTGWFFERELSDLEPITGIRITRGFVVPPGAVPALTDHELRRELVAAGDLPEPVAAPLVEVPLNTLETAPAASAEDEAPRVRVIKPSGTPVEGTAPDVVQAAIQDAKTAVPPRLEQAAALGRGKRTLARVQQSYVGELTGSITGNVWCYGYALDAGICVYVNLGGPRMAVEAIRAKLSKGDIISVVPWDAPSVELTAGEGNSGMYHDYFANLPEARFTSLILLHESVVHPNYGGKSTTFLLYVSAEQAVGQLHRHIAQLAKIPVFDIWAAYLWTAGQAAMLVRKARGEGGLTVYRLDLDIDSWTRLITGGIEQGVIALP